MVELALRPNTNNQNWNIPAIHPITGDELIQIVRELTGYQKSIRQISSGIIRLMGAFPHFL